MPWSSPPTGLSISKYGSVLPNRVSASSRWCSVYSLLLLFRQTMLLAIAYAATNVRVPHCWPSASRATSDGTKRQPSSLVARP